MRAALHAEWTTLRTVPGPRWLSLGMIVATVALATAAASVLTCRSNGCGGDAVRIGDPSWQRLLQQLAPASAGLAVTAGWSAAALVGGGLLLRVRDQ